MKLAAGLWCTKTWLGLGGCCCCCCKAAAAGSWGWKYTLMGCWGWPGCTAEGWTCDCTGWPAEETPWLTTVPVAAETVGGICIWGWGGCPMWWAGGAWWWWWWWCPTRGWYWGCWEGGGACRGCCAGVGPGGGCIFSAEPCESKILPRHVFTSFQRTKFLCFFFFSPINVAMTFEGKSSQDSNHSFVSRYVTGEIMAEFLNFLQGWKIDETF